MDNKLNLGRKGRAVLTLAFIVAFGIISAGTFTLAPSGGNWIIDGDVVYIDDSNVFIHVEPHTLHSSGWVYINFTPKSYTGDIDMLWGFDMDQVRPSKAELYNPHTEYWNTNHQRDFYNVSGFENTGDPCDYGNEYNTYKRLVNHTTQNGTDNSTNTTIWNYTSDVVCFDSYNNISDDYRAYWHTEHSREVDYTDISDRFDSVDYEYGGNNKWYYITDIPVTAGEDYMMRAKMQVPVSLEGISGKYWVALKPSGETIGEAISNGHLYYLDPWWNSSWGKCKNITITENKGSGDLTDYQVKLNVTYDSDMDVAFTDLRFVNSSCNNGGSELDYYLGNKVDGTWATVWTKVDTISNATDTIISMYYDNDSVVSSNSNGENTFTAFEDGSDCSSDWTQDPTYNGGSISSSSTFSVVGTTSCYLQTASATKEYDYFNVTNQTGNFYIGYWIRDNSTMTDSRHGQALTQDTSHSGGEMILMIDYGSTGTQWNSYWGSAYHNTGLTYAIDTWYHVELYNFDFSGYTHDWYIDDAVANTSNPFRNNLSWAEQMEYKCEENPCRRYIDEVIVVQWVDPAPTTAFGAEESDGGGAGASSSISVTLDYPADSSTNTSLTVSHGYTPVALNSTIHNCSLYNNISSSWLLTHSNSTPITNDTVNTIAEEYTEGMVIKWNIGCYNDTGEYFATSNRTLTIDEPPKIENETQNTSTPTNGDAVNLTIDAYDWDQCWLSTNETGSWANLTTGSSSLSYQWSISRQEGGGCSWATGLDIFTDGNIVWNGFQLDGGEQHPYIEELSNTGAHVQNYTGKGTTGHNEYEFYGLGLDSNEDIYSIGLYDDAGDQNELWWAKNNGTDLSEIWNYTSTTNSRSRLWNTEIYINTTDDSFWGAGTVCDADTDMESGYVGHYNSTGSHIENHTVDLYNNMVDIFYTVKQNSSGHLILAGFGNVTWSGNSTGSVLFFGIYDSAFNPVCNQSYTGAGSTKLAGMDLELDGTDVYLATFFNDDGMLFRFDGSCGQTWNITYDSGDVDEFRDVELYGDYAYVSGESGTDSYIGKYEKSDGSNVWNKTQAFKTNSYADRTNNLLVNGTSIYTAMTIDGKVTGYDGGCSFQDYAGVAKYTETFSSDYNSPNTTGSEDASDSVTFIWENDSVTDSAVAWKVYCNDSSGNENVSITQTFTLSAGGDSTAPTYSDIIEPTDPSTYSYSGTYQFNATWQDETALGTVWIEENMTGALGNTTVTTNASSEYYYDVSSLGAGTYSVMWCANDSTGNENCTSAATFTVNTATLQLALATNGTWTYPTQTNTTGSESNSGDGDVTYYLYRNGTLADSTTPYWDNTTLAADYYLYRFNASSGANYTANSTGLTIEVTIDKAVLGGSLNINTTWTEAYPTATEVTVTESNSGDGDVTYKIYRNGSDKGSSDAALLGADIYSYVLNSTGGANYTTNSSIDSDTLTINTGVLACSISGSGVTYPNAVSVTPSESQGGDSDVNYTFWRNTTLVSSALGSAPSSDTSQLGAALYHYILNSTGGANWTSNSSIDTHDVTVSSGTSIIKLYVNGTATNYSTDNGTAINLTSLLQTPAIAGTVYVYRNETLWDTGTSPLYNVTENWTVGLWPVKANWTGNGNYTYDEETWYVNVSESTSTSTSTSTTTTGGGGGYIPPEEEDDFPFYIEYGNTSIMRSDEKAITFKVAPGTTYAGNFRIINTVNETREALIYTVYNDDDSNDWYTFRDGALMRDIANYDIADEQEVYFEIKPPINSDYGSYEATLLLKDTATNTSMDVVLYTNVTTTEEAQTGIPTITDIDTGFLDNIIFEFRKPILGRDAIYVRDLVYLAAWLLVLFILVIIGKKAFGGKK